MLKQTLQSWLPSSEKVASSKIMKLFGSRTRDPLLWYVNRRSISRAVLIGAFFGLLPIPFHSILIILAVLMLEVNLPIGLSLAWLTNPFTIAPILYVAFWIGSKIYHVQMIDKEVLLTTFHQVSAWLSHFGHGYVDTSMTKVLFSGLLIEALSFSLILYIITLLFWRWSTIHQWHKRHYFLKTK
ncbi:DUF2062 domain-containing protein [Acinetobacter nectaris]|uniref:DUF2062 domain-containing protein n=1 Tax=Acinetobacter nectaris TaxID=1219382 RepID=UPI001F17AC2B|nr:DUF2062 domain-containing protein [Acinetobacter nectaris]MCF8998540.1 DUF2062 domain-containing protein [Acinetobacter nectaris]MCF9026807.1 DUF2062 domain-containing protein [Acinetobacter nectaris]